MPPKRPASRTRDEDGQVWPSTMEEKSTLAVGHLGGRRRRRRRPGDSGRCRHDSSRRQRWWFSTLVSLHRRPGRW